MIRKKTQLQAALVIGRDLKSLSWPPTELHAKLEQRGFDFDVINQVIVTLFETPTEEKRR